MMKTMKKWISGLFLSAVCLLPLAVQAAELQPFFTLKVSSVNDLTAIADKFAGMAGVADDVNFRQFVATAKGIKGVNPNGIAGFAAADNDGEIVPMLMLPITDIWNLEVPNFPNVGDSIRPFLVKDGEGQYIINSPLGNYIAAQKKDYLILIPENAVDQIPADAVKLFAGLEKYALGFRLDAEKVNFDTIEGKIFGPLVMMLSMQDPDVGEQFEGVIEIYRSLFKSLQTLSWGIAVNPQTADIEYGGTFSPRKGSEWEKGLATIKFLPTMFSGFRGTPGNNVVSLGISMTSSDAVAKEFYTPEIMNTAFMQYETLLTGFFEQSLGDEGTPEEAAEKAKKLLDSVKKIAEADATRGAGDLAFSLSTDGTLLAASETVSLAEIRNLIAMIKEMIVTMHAPPEGFETFIVKNLKKEYTEIEGFKVSNLKIPFAEFPENEEGIDPFRDMTPGFYWAVKEMEDKQVIAFAAGLDSAKTEQLFKSALEKTKTPAPYQPPLFTFHTQGIGKLLQQTVLPLVKKSGAAEDELPTFNTVADILASADNGATVTLDYDIKPNQLGAVYRISGKSVEAVVKAVKAVIDSQNQPEVQDF